MSQRSVRRIAIWTHPRSLSTVLSQCLAGRDDTICFHEPFGVAYLAKVADYMVHPGFVEPHQNFSKVKQMLESDQVGKTVVAFKDIAVNMHGRFQHIPEGFTHIFLIREPIRSMYSFARLKDAANIKEQGWAFFMGWSNRAVYRLYRYVTEELKQESIIIDAYDLSHHPEKILKILCKKVGIPYKESMLTWRDRNMDGWHNHWKENNYREPLFGKALDGTCFRPLPDKDESMDTSMLSHENRIILEKSTHIYEMLYEKRIKPMDWGGLFSTSKL